MPVPDEPSDETIWRQGTVVPANGVERLVEADQLPAVWLQAELVLVVSHSCDLAAADFASEPYAEVIPAWRLEEIDGNRTHGKSPREYHLTVERGGGSVAVAIHAHERRFVDRQLLLSMEPGRPLDRESVRGLARWLGKRYWREAFPDAFNARLQPASEKIRRAMKRGGGPTLSGIYVQLSTLSELEEGQSYAVGILGAMRESDYEHSDCRDACQKTLDRLSELFDSMEGIEVTEYELVSEADVSLDDLRYYQRWDSADDLSLRSAESIIAPDPG